MDIAKVRELTDNELADELAKQRRHLYDLRFQLATRQLTDYSQLTQTRRTIARILTVATEREATGSGPIVAAPKVRSTKAGSTRPSAARAAKPAKTDATAAAPRARRSTTALASAAAKPATAGAPSKRSASRGTE
jgi:large subunit ribosomal protein L29